MQIKLNSRQKDFLIKITSNTPFKEAVSMFPVNQDFEANEELLDELRELCAEVEVDSVQEGNGVIRDDDGKIAADLVDLFYS